MIHGDLSADLLRTIFSPRTALHDGAVIIRGDAILAAGAVLPLAETTIHTERFGTRHRAALGIAEQTDALVVVVSEENSQVSLVERSRIVRNLNEPQLAAALRTLLDPTSGRRGTLAWRSGGHRWSRAAGRATSAGSWAGPRRVPPRAPSDDEPPTDRGRSGAAVTRLLRVVVHNWPLKLAAIGLATLLYAGLVLSQSTQTFNGIIPVTIGQPARRHVPGDDPVDPVTEVRYFSPTGRRAHHLDLYRATVDVTRRGAGLRSDLRAGDRHLDRRPDQRHRVDARRRDRPARRPRHPR